MPAIDSVRKKYKHRARLLVQKLQTKGHLQLNAVGHIIFAGEVSNITLSTALCSTYYSLKQQTLPSDIKKWVKLLVDNDLEKFIVNEDLYDHFAWYKI